MQLILKRISYFFIFLIYANYISLSCAAIQSPPGGDKDTISPFIVNSIPSNGSTGFPGGEVNIFFSEYLKESSVESSVEILPNIEPKPLIEFKGDLITVYFPDSLLSNQTYIISINRSLQDEHNFFLNKTLQIAYSTGTYIDSGMISGKIHFDEESSAHLWKINYNDKIEPFYNRVPDYVLNADDDGNYKFNYLSKGTYRMIGVEKSGTNLPLNPKIISFGLPFKNILILDSINTHHKNINVLISQDKVFNLKRGEFLGLDWGSIQFSGDISKVFDLIKLKIISNNKLLIPELEQDEVDKDKVYFFLKDTVRSNDDILIKNNLVYQGEIILIDSSKLMVKSPVKSLKDTILIAINNRIQSEKLKIKKDKINPFDLYFSIPLYDSLNTDYIQLMLDTTSINFQGSWVSPRHLQIFPIKNWSPKSKYKIEISNKAIFPKLLNKIKDSTYVFNFESEDYSSHGNLTGVFERFSDNQFFIKTIPITKNINGKKSIVDLDSSFYFLEMNEGIYQLMIFEDIDKSTKYSYGSLSPYKPSEWFMYYTDSIQVRNNWDLELDPIKAE